MQLKKAVRKLKAFAVVVSVIIVINPVTTIAYDLSSPTQQQIKDMYEQNPFVTTKKAEYIDDYLITSPYKMGKISDKTQNEALNALNFCRYIAGLPADVQLKDEYIEKAQAGSLVNAANNVLSHTPVKPTGMSDALYNLGYAGTSHSNIAYGYANPAATVIGYMEDSDPGNIAQVGHRRWILNPKMKYSGFGCVDKYSAMYAFDTARTDNFTGDYISWPGKNMPYELYDTGYAANYAFSVTLGNGYDTPVLSKVNVRVTSSKLGKSWNIDSACRDTSGVYMNVENSNYGTPKCIIFSVGEKFPENDVVSVSVSGITKSGVEKDISYNVNFFNMFDHSFKSEYNVNVGDTITVASQNPLDSNNYRWSWSVTGCTDIHINSNSAEITGLKVGKTNFTVTNRNDGSVQKFVVNVLPKTAELKYQLMDLGDGTFGVRFVLVADEEIVRSIDSASVYISVPDDGDSEAINIKRAYKSLIAAGKTVTAGEGKVFLLGKFMGIPEDMLDGITGHFKLGDQTFDRTITL